MTGDSDLFLRNLVHQLQTTIRQQQSTITAQREFIQWVLEPALKFYREGPEPEVASQSLRKLEEMRAARK